MYRIKQVTHSINHSNEGAFPAWQCMVWQGKPVTWHESVITDRQKQRELLQLVATTAPWSMVWCMPILPIWIWFKLRGSQINEFLLTLVEDHTNTMLFPTCVKCSIGYFARYPNTWTYYPRSLFNPRCTTIIQPAASILFMFASFLASEPYQTHRHTAKAYWFL